jgi:hypothetical protein
MLLFFTVSGAAQLFMLHVDNKTGYQAPAILRTLGNIHVHQRLASESSSLTLSAPFRYLSLAMAIGLLATLVLGILMAAASASARTGWRLFLAGALAPAVALWLGTLSEVAAWLRL